MPGKMPFKVSALILSWLIKSLLTGPVDTMAQSFDAAWISATSGSWSELHRWNTFGFLPYPNNEGEDTYNVLIALNASPTITLDTHVNILSLDLASGYLKGSHTLTALNEVTWRGGGLIGGQGQLIAAGEMHLMGTSKLFQDFQLLNQDKATWTSGDILASNDAIFKNQPQASLIIRFDANWIMEEDALKDSIIDNQGLVQKEGGQETTHIQARLLNTGKVEWLTGTLHWEGSIENFGSMSGSEGTTLRISGPYVDHQEARLSSKGILEFSDQQAESSIQGYFEGGTHTAFKSKQVVFESAAQLEALGNHVTIQGGKLLLDSEEAIRAETLTLTAEANLGGGDEITITQSFTWNNGTVLSGANNLRSINESVWSLDEFSSKPRTLSERSLINQGSIIWEGGDTLMRQGARLINEADALFLDHHHGSLLLDALPDTSHIINHGKWIKEASGGWTTLGPGFINHGEVELKQGNIQWDGMVSNLGSIHSVAGQIMRFDAGYESSAQATLISEGSIEFRDESAKITVAGIYQADEHSLFAGPSITFGPDAIIRDLGQLTTIEKGQLIFQNGHTNHFHQLKLASPGALQSSAPLILEMGGYWEAGSQVEGTGFLINLGLLEWSKAQEDKQAKGLLGLDWFANQGIMEWKSGDWGISPNTTLINTANSEWYIRGPVNSLVQEGMQGPSFINEGIFSVDAEGGTVQLDWQIDHRGHLHIHDSALRLASAFEVESGIIQLRNGSIYAPSIRLSSAQVNGNGILGGVVQCEGDNHLKLNQQALTIDGTLSLDPSSTLKLTMQTLKSGLVLLKPAELRGKLSFTWEGQGDLAHGSVIDLIYASPTTGRFEEIIWVNQPSGYMGKALYHDHGVSMIILHEEALERQDLLLIPRGGMMMIFLKPGLEGAILQSTSELGKLPWQDHGPLTEGMLGWNLADDPQRFFRIKP